MASARRRRKRTGRPRRRSRIPAGIPTLCNGPPWPAARAGGRRRAAWAAGGSVAAPLYATGDGKSDLPQLAAALGQADEKAAKRLAASAAMSVVMPKLPWPEGRLVLEALSHSPVLFVLAALGN